MRSLTAHFTAAEAGPEDVLVAKIQRILAGDAKLVAIFGADRIEGIPLPDAPDWRDGPRLQVFHGAVPEEQQFPGNADRRQVAIIVRIRLDWREWEPMVKGSPVAPWPYAVPSLATLENQVLTTLKAARQLAEVINGEDVQLAAKAPTIGPFQTAGADPDPHNPESIVFLRDCRALYEVLLDHPTGRLLNVVKAGAGA